MLKKIDKETTWGAIFAVIAIIATIGELISNGVSINAILSAVKDISGTIITVLLFVFSLRKIFSETESKLSKILDKELELFGNKYEPLVFKVSNFEKMQNEKYEQGFCILKDFSKFISIGEITNEMKEKYSSRNSHETAKFVDLPSTSTMINENFKICFRTLQTCIYDDNFLKEVSNKIAYKYKECEYKTYAKNNCLIVEIPKIESKENIKTLISLLELVIIYFQIGNKGVIKI